MVAPEGVAKPRRHGSDAVAADGNRSERWRTSANHGGRKICDLHTGRTLVNCGELKSADLKTAKRGDPPAVAGSPATSAHPSSGVVRWPKSRGANVRVIGGHVNEASIAETSAPGPLTAARLAALSVTIERLGQALVVGGGEILQNLEDALRRLAPSTSQAPSRVVGSNSGKTSAATLVETLGSVGPYRR